MEYAGTVLNQQDIAITSPSFMDCADRCKALPACNTFVWCGYSMDGCHSYNSSVIEVPYRTCTLKHSDPASLGLPDALNMVNVAYNRSTLQSGVLTTSK